MVSLNEHKRGILILIGHHTLEILLFNIHLHLVDSAPILGVLGLGVACVDDLLVVVQKLLADRTFGVQVL